MDRESAWWRDVFMSLKGVSQTITLKPSDQIHPSVSPCKDIGLFVTMLIDLKYREMFPILLFGSPLRSVTHDKTAVLFCLILIGEEENQVVLGRVHCMTIRRRGSEAIHSTLFLHPIATENIVNPEEKTCFTHALNYWIKNGRKKY